MSFYFINKTLLFFAFVSILSCRSDDKLTGVAAGAAGRYQVTTYIVAGDTLFSSLPNTVAYKPVINKIGVDNFIIAIGVTGSDQLIIRSSYWRKGVRSDFSREVVVSLTNYDYQFSLKTSTPSVTLPAYNGSVGRFTKFFYERTVGGGLLIPPAGSPANSSQSSSQEVILIAQPQP